MSGKEGEVNTGTKNRTKNGKIAKNRKCAKSKSQKCQKMQMKNEKCSGPEPGKEHTQQQPWNPSENHKKNECESKNLPVSLGHLRTKGRGENSEVEREEKLKLKNLN